MAVPAKTDYFNDDDFVVNEKDWYVPKYYKDVPAKKVNKAFNIVKSEPTNESVNNRKHNRKFRRNRKNESVMTPIPSYTRQNSRFYAPATSTGNANVLVNEIAKLRLEAPIKCRQVVIENVCDTGVNIIATRTIDE